MLRFRRIQSFQNKKIETIYFQQSITTLLFQFNQSDYEKISVTLQLLTSNKKEPKSDITKSLLTFFEDVQSKVQKVLVLFCHTR